MRNGLILDHDLALSVRLGAGRGIDLTRLKSMGPTLHVAHGVLEDARAKGLMPLHRAGLEEDGTWAAEQLEDWTERYDRLIVIGEPGALRGVMGLASLGNGDRIRCIDGPDPRGIGNAFRGAESVHLVVLGGPSWVTRLAEWVAPDGAPVTVLSGDGTGEIPLGLNPDWNLVETGWGADARFGRLSRLGLALAGWSGLDLEKLIAVACAQLEACEVSEMMMNPAYRLAAMVQGFEEELDLQGMLGLIPLGSQACWAQGLCELWASMTARRALGPAQVSWSGTTHWMLAGDESVVQARLGGADRLWAWAIWSDEMPSDIALDRSTSAWTLCRALMDAQIQQMVEAGCPVIRLRLGQMEPEQLASMDVLFLVTAMTLGALRGTDPLAMPAADRFRELHNGSFADNGGD